MPDEVDCAGVADLVWGRTCLDDRDEGLHRLSVTVLMTPDTSNFSGNVHGGRPAPVPSLVPRTAVERRRHAAAEHRREMEQREAEIKVGRGED